MSMVRTLVPSVWREGVGKGGVWPLKCSFLSSGCSKGRVLRRPAVVGLDLLFRDPGALCISAGSTENCVARYPCCGLALSVFSIWIIFIDMVVVCFSLMTKVCSIWPIFKSGSKSVYPENGSLSLENFNVVDFVMVPLDKKTIICSRYRILLPFSH